MRLLVYCCGLIQLCLASLSLTHEALKGLDPGVLSLALDGCRYSAPWYPLVVPLSEQACAFKLPRCGRDSTVNFTLESLGTVGDTLWNMSWGRDQSFVATKVEDGLWLELNQTVAVMQVVPSLQFVTFTLQWALNHTLTVTHSADPFGAVTLIWPEWDTPEALVSCTLGPLNTNLLAVDASSAQLLAQVSQPSLCRLRAVNVRRASERWTFPSNHSATLALEPWDWARCRAQGDWSQAWDSLSGSVAVTTDTLQTACWRYTFTPDHPEATLTRC
jgi:hypothetical protein